MGQGLVKLWQIVQAKRTGIAIPEKKKPVPRQKKAKAVVGGDIRQWMKDSS